MVARFLEEFVTSVVDFLDRRSTLQATGVAVDDEPIIRNTPIQPFGFVCDCIDDVWVEEGNAHFLAQEKVSRSCVDEELPIRSWLKITAVPDYVNDPFYSWHPVNIYYSPPPQHIWTDLNRPLSIL